MSTYTTSSHAHGPHGDQHSGHREPGWDASRDDGSWAPGKYEGHGTGYDDGKWAPGKYEGHGTGYDDGKWHGDSTGAGAGASAGRHQSDGTHHAHASRDDGSWAPGKYEGHGTGYDDGKWAPGKYEGHGTGYDDGKWHGDSTGASAGRHQSDGAHHAHASRDDGSWAPGKYEGHGTGYDDGKWAPGKYEGHGTGHNDGQWPGHSWDTGRSMQDGSGDALAAAASAPADSAAWTDGHDGLAYDAGSSTVDGADAIVAVVGV